MGVEVNGNGDNLFELSDEFGDVKRGHDAGHIFQTEGVRPHVLEFSGLGEVILEVEHIAPHAPFCQRVTDGALKVFAI